MRAPVSSLRCVWITRALTVGVVLCATPAFAQEHGQREPIDSFSLPPQPDEHAPFLAGEVHLDAVFPIARRSICPENADCIFGGGSGIGGSLERRWPTGIGLSLGYDAWFLDGNGVYELAVMHVLRVGVRYFFLESLRVHPFIGANVGALVYGDTLRMATVGGAADGTLGAEIELTETLSLSISLPVRVFTTAGFVTPRDKVERADGPGLNAAIAFRLGVTVLEAP